MHVLIIGAGLGGLSLAQNLRKQGISFEIFERDTNKDVRFQGWAIALHHIIGKLSSSFPEDLPDLKASTNHLAPLNLPAQISMYMPGRTDKVGFQDSPQLPLIRAERRRLRNWLADKIPIQWGKRVTRFEQDDGGVTAYFEDGGSAKGDILIGADGVNSVVREHLLHRPGSELLKVVPLATIVGELTLSGDALKRQLSLGHSGYMIVYPDLGFLAFVGLHYVHSDGLSGRYYWNTLQQDPDVSRPDHWLQKASQQEKLDHVREATAKLPSHLREIFEITPVDGIRPQAHVWRDLELESLPAGRVVLVGDAVHAMTPFRGEGGFHTFLDTLSLGEILGELNSEGKFGDITVVRQAVAKHNEDMLERGGQAVRDSRNMHAAAQRRGPDGKPVIVEMMPLPDVEIVLGARA